jgi:(1->4)-alpha-D-glucan 1-alpha-D-glucosylmutase
VTTETRPARPRTAQQILAAVAERLAGVRLPAATYRLQLHRGFDFQDARRLLPYLDALGISDVYASPYLRARTDSSHGYDVTDHSMLNPALGSAADYAAFTAELRRRGLGQVLDVVPNHMGIGEASNAWWMDVLENGPSSYYAGFFDIHWHPSVQPALEDKVLLPILGDQYGRILEKGELRLTYEAGAFFLNYWENKLPLAPASYIPILEHELGALTARLGEEDAHVLELQSILTALRHLPPRGARERARILEKRREKEIVKRRLAALVAASPEVQAAIAAALTALNGRSGDPRSFDALDRILDDQAYRLAFWRVAAEEINYRRFFDVNQLAALRMEDPQVFAETHRLILRLVAEGHATGLRIDHPDGLLDPAGYFRRLQEARFLQLSAEALGEEPPPELRGALLAAFRAEVAATPPETRTAGGHPTLACPLFLVAEKILAREEPLPPDWLVHGTTGYEFANAATGLLVDTGAARAFTNLYSGFTEQRTRYADLVNSSKKMIMLVSLASEINTLAHGLDELSERNRWYRDFTLNSLTFAIREVIASLPVYRTYLNCETERAAPRDRAYIEAAVRDARRRNPRTAAEIFDFLRDILLLKYPENVDEAGRNAQCDFVLKFQQTSGPVMAKGVEDTAFYIYNRLVALNEVGGEPDRFGTPLAEFDRFNAERAARTPYALLATSTHDTKRSEDVRARMSVLSELPREWRVALARWHRLNRRHKATLEEGEAPTRNDEYLLYQTLLGAWPLEEMDAAAYASFVRRLQAYMLKATKEAKANTSWVNSNEAYDRAVADFVAAILRRGRNPFLKDFLPFERRIRRYGLFNALSQTLLKLTSPGVPDIYQGNEVWDFSLVDPDNRRPVDFERRAALLRALQRRRPSPSLARELVGTLEDGRIKLHVTQAALAARRANPELFTCGAYVPLPAAGARAENVCAFRREHAGRRALVVAPRFYTRLAGEGAEPLGALAWADTTLEAPDGRYRDAFTGERLRVRGGSVALAELCAHFPVALLLEEGGD